MEMKLIGNEKKTKGKNPKWNENEGEFDDEAVVEETGVVWDCFWVACDFLYFIGFLMKFVAFLEKIEREKESKQKSQNSTENKTK